ncbi:MAG TPA: DNRLRE domain-containing protein [Ardenticatenaceae bacterium]|jgi:hypothetical protein
MSHKSNGGMKWGIGVVALVLALAGCAAPSPANPPGSETLTATWTPALSADAPTDANATAAVTATVELTGTVATVETAVTIEPTSTVTEEITSTTPISDTRPITSTTPITDVAPSEPGAAGAGLTFGAEADTQVREFEPSVIFGSEPTLRADGGTDPLHESYLRFTVTGLEGPVARATLRLYAETGAAAGLSVYTTANEWSEAETNWTNRPPRSETALDVQPEEVRAQTWVEFDVTEAVTGDGTYSFVIGIGESNGLAMTSKEGNPEMAPQLVIEVEN